MHVAAADPLLALSLGTHRYVTMCLLDAYPDAATNTKSALVAYDAAKQAANAVERLHNTKLVSGHTLHVVKEGAPGERGRPY